MNDTSRDGARLREALAREEFLKSRCEVLSCAVDGLSKQVAQLATENKELLDQLGLLQQDCVGNVVGLTEEED